MSRPIHPGISPAPSFWKHFNPILQSASTSQSPSHRLQGDTGEQFRIFVIKGTVSIGEGICDLAGTDIGAGAGVRIEVGLLVAVSAKALSMQ
jgi:hypothetical protein